ncbi:MAG: polysaccharide deacetylase family protein [Rhodomicrobium sp.]|nr:polysaccharide deacetylase family protein [Rhodomicrobium sp.]
MFFRFAASAMLASLAFTGFAHAECPGRPDALGVSRVIAVDPSLPRVLDALAAECVKATFFVVGQMATAYPETVQRIQREGHTIGTHTMHHAHLDRMSKERAAKEIDGGMSAVSKVLGAGSAIAPFFRFPYLDSTGATENYALKRGLAIWSVDFFVNDWTHISPGQVSAYAIKRIESKKRGIFLLHDIQARTAEALPALLQEMKKRNYRIVHIVPADENHPQTVTVPHQWTAMN